ncbi:hypothetical protein [Amycolatopsis sp. cmx-11-51]|uniref:hypothetical protein n=1 Tax=unclassified Amycolatopsis TaxID=2618356 RepID=UPI0039E647B7
MTIKAKALVLGVAVLTVLGIGTAGAAPEGHGARSRLDIDLAGDLAQRLGVGLHSVQTAWKSIADDVGRKCDLAMGGVSVTLNRARKGFYTAPTFVTVKRRSPCARTKNGSRPWSRSTSRVSVRS